MDTNARDSRSLFRAALRGSRVSTLWHSQHSEIPRRTPFSNQQTKRSVARSPRSRFRSRSKARPANRSCSTRTEDPGEARRRDRRRPAQRFRERAHARRHRGGRADREQDARRDRRVRAAAARRRARDVAAPARRRRHLPRHVQVRPLPHGRRSEAPALAEVVRVPPRSQGRQGLAAQQRQFATAIPRGTHRRAKRSTTRAI